MQANDKTLTTRRGFFARLVGLAATAGLAAAKSAESAESQAEPVVEQPEQAQSSSYRKTEHVRAYYRSVRD